MFIQTQPTDDSNKMNFLPGRDVYTTGPMKFETAEETARSPLAARLMNIEEIVAVDKKLDPNLHQAMMEVEDENKEPGTIVQEIQKGYIMKDRLLRPSLVAVSKKPQKNEEKSEKNEKK
mgnify:CR=1 FL=1